MIIAIVGPTASGKTALSVQLAHRLAPAQIVSADAMQLYRGMDIGTAKATIEEREGIPHHQLDLLEVTEDASVAAYQTSARADIAQIQAQDHTPIVVGGSGLYLRALLDQIDFPGTDPAVRARLEAIAAEEDPVVFHRRLQQADPVAATRIEPANVRRVVRALEVIELTGQPFSANLPDYTYVQPAFQFGLRPDMDKLDERISVRTRRMFEQGLIAETERLLEMGVRDGKTAARATGYAQALAVIDGVMNEEEEIEAVSLATRQLARKQMKWFRRDPRIHWIDIADSVDNAVEHARDIVLKEQNT